MNKKQVIRLTESDLHRIIKESVNKMVGIKRNLREWVDEGGECLDYLEEMEQRLNDMSQGMYGQPTENESFWEAINEALYHIREAISEIE